MKNIDGISNTTEQSIHVQSNYTEKQSVNSHIHIASSLVDQITQSLYVGIKNGDIHVQDLQIPLRIDSQKENSPAKYVAQFKFIDPHDHKILIKKFMKQNLQQTQQRRIRSLEQHQKERKLKQQQLKMQQQIRNKSIQQRRKQIQKRLNEKKQIMEQISKSILQSSAKISEIRKKKFLYQVKEQEQQQRQRAQMQQTQKMLMAKKKMLREPMHLQTILSHQKQYETMRLTEHNERMTKIKMHRLQNNSYDPPKFVPTAFKMIEQEQFIKEKEQQLKRKQLQLLDYRKKQYVQKIQQIQQRERKKSIERPRSFSPYSLATQQKSQTKFNREQIRDIGNSYLKQVLQNNKKLRNSRKLKSIRTQQITTQVKAKRNKSLEKSKILIQAEMEILQKKKIEEIIKTEKLNGYQKCQRLKKQIAKLDESVVNKMKSDQDLDSSNKSAQVLLSSINAKVAFLYFAQS